MVQRSAAASALLLLGFLVQPGVASAGVGLGIGALAGANMTTFSGDVPEDSSWKPRRGFEAGGFVDVVLSPHVTISTQAMFMRKSPMLEIKTGEEDADGEPLTEQVKTEIDYFVLPVMAQYIFGEGNTNFFIEGGVEFSFMQDATLYRDGTPEDVKSVINDTDFAAATGLGVKSKVGPFDWFASLRFTIGLENVAMGDPIEGSVREVVWKSRGSQFLAGISFPILK